MATVVLGAIGAGVGAMFGDPTLGWAVGTMMAGVLFPPKGQNQARGKLDDLRVSGSGYGAMIPQLYGLTRVGGNIIWATNLVEHSSTKKSGGKGGPKVTTRSYTYTVSFAVSLCRGPITRVRRIWAEDRLIYNYADNTVTAPATAIRIYNGTETQQPDSLIASSQGGSAPAFRGTAYVVFDTLELSAWGNRIPAMTFEVEQNEGLQRAILATSGLQAFYQFEAEPGRLGDSGPNVWALSDVGGTSTTVTGHAGLTGWRAASGVKSQRTLGNVAALQGPKVTVEAWLQWQSTTTGGVHVRYLNPNTGEYSFDLFASVSGGNTNLLFRVFTNASGVVEVFNTNVVQDTNWHHVVVTYDQAGSASLYFDGGLLSTVNSPVSNLTITGDAANAISLEGGDYALDAVAIYNTILSSADVGAHYSAASTSADILADLFRQCGLIAGQWDLSAALSTINGGYAIANRTQASSIIHDLLLTQFLDLAEWDGKLHAIARGGNSVVTVPNGDLGAYTWASSGSASPQSHIQTKRLQDLDLPRQVDLTYFSTGASYDQATQTAQRYTKSWVQEPLTVNTSWSTDDTTARQTAEKLLYDQWAQREQFSFVLPPAYLQYTPGDIVTVPVAGSSVRVKIIGQDIALFGPIQFTAVLDDTNLLAQTVAGQTVTAATLPSVATATTLLAWSSNGLRDSDTLHSGFYWAVCGQGSGDWPGCTLYWSRDSGTTYQVLDSCADPVSYGTCQTILPPPAAWEIWDTVSTVDVLFTSGTPTSTTDADVLGGANAIRIGSEVIQFVTATALGSGVYRLSRLLRGRRGTDPFMASHQASETAVLLNFGQVQREDLDESLKGKTIALKAVTTGSTLAATSAQNLTISGAEWTCYAPCQVTGSRDGSQNLTISWKRRTRAQGELTDNYDVPLNETTESYDVDVMNGSTVVRTFAGLTSSTVSYTAGQQVTDFGSTQSSVTLRVFQNGKYGRGYPATATV